MNSLIESIHPPWISRSLVAPEQLVVVEDRRIMKRGVCSYDMFAVPDCCFLIMWHTSELIVWRSGSESGTKMSVACRFLQNSRLQTLLGISEGSLGTIVCQIMRTRMCQIISKTTVKPSRRFSLWGRFAFLLGDRGNLTPFLPSSFVRGRHG